MATVYKPPALLPNLVGRRSIFLSGSIEMGKAEDWQSRMERELSDIEDLIILNPRRDDWDASWVQEIGNKQFFDQVSWELCGLEEAMLVPTYLVPGTMSPITLLEIGLFTTTKAYGIGAFQRSIVCCPDGFWRKGNIDIVCQRYGVQQVPDLESLIAETRRRLE